MDAPKAVYQASSQTEAEIIRNLLRSAGIEAETSGDDSGGMLPILQITEGVAVLVDGKDWDEASGLIEDYRQGKTSISEDAAE